LPGLIARIEPSGSAIHAKQVALLVGCAVVALGLWPVSRLRFSSFPVRERKLYPRNPFLLRFLPAIAIWSLVTGSFSPFFNAYFSQHLRVSVDKIGVISSGSQLAQVLAMLMAPVIFRKFGLVSGVAGTQIATALALGCLAASTARPGAFVAYASFSAFLWMSEPGMYSLLMNRLAPAEHAGASALNFLVISGAQAIAALLAGLSFARFGYPVVLCVIAGVALLAALMSWRLLGSSARSVRLQVDADYA
jgi:predicted MFS family arabinose efflux permease